MPLLPLNFVDIGPSPDSCIRKLAEFVLVTSMATKYGGSGGLICSHPNSIRRKPLMRRSHIPICLSVSVPVQPDTDGPAYAVPNGKNCELIDEYTGIHVQMKYSKEGKEEKKNECEKSNFGNVHMGIERTRIV